MPINRILKELTDQLEQLSRNSALPQSTLQAARTFIQSEHDKISKIKRQGARSCCVSYLPKPESSKLVGSNYQRFIRDTDQGLEQYVISLKPIDHNLNEYAYIDLKKCSLVLTVPSRRVNHLFNAAKRELEAHFKNNLNEMNKL